MTRRIKIIEMSRRTGLNSMTGVADGWDDQGDEDDQEDWEECDDQDDWHDQDTRTWMIG